MSITGHWKLSITSPMGTQESELKVEGEGSSLRGTQSADGVEGEIFDGSIDGNTVSWSVKVNQPLPMTLTFSGSFDASSMSGNVKAGMFGSFPFSGTRIA